MLIFRHLVNLIDGITGLLEGLMRLLLPLAVAVVVIFLATLPFTGLAPCGRPATARGCCCG